MELPFLADGVGVCTGCHVGMAESQEEQQSRGGVEVLGRAGQGGPREMVTFEQ